VDVAAGTYFPRSFNAEGNLELPYRILLRADLGPFCTVYVKIPVVDVTAGYRF
jgi:hypothetical protein